MLIKRYGRISQLMLLQDTTFDDKVKSVKDSEEKQTDVIEKYQVCS